MCSATQRGLTDRTRLGINMRLTQYFCKRGWLPENKVEFQELLPLRLKNSVSGKSEKEESSGCVQEIINLINCLKNTNYDQALCSKEINILSQCHTIHKETMRKEKEQSKKGFLNPGAKRLNHRQIGVLLKRFPTN